MNTLGILINSTDKLTDDLKNELIERSQSFYQALSLAAWQSGMLAVFFTPHAINWDLNRVQGYVLHPKRKRWCMRTFALPKLIYDRCFSRNRRQYMSYRYVLNKLQQSHHSQLLARPLPSKWALYAICQREVDLQRVLPYTKQYTGIHSLTNWFKQSNELFLKPSSGSQGRGTIYVNRHDRGSYMLRGRTHHNTPFQKIFTKEREALHWLGQVLHRQRYLMQQYLHLTTPTGEPFDVRVLMQKNGHGQWKITGSALRRGKSDSMTSNLHGGGHAEEVFPYLMDVFGEEKAFKIQAMFAKISYQVAACLEQHCGRLLELGIDYGIDHSGKIWLLEANSKPGRAIFQQLCLDKQRELSVQRPIQYARSILERQLGG